jgi:hypothetical protein
MMPSRLDSLDRALCARLASADPEDQRMAASAAVVLAAEVTHLSGDGVEEALAAVRECRPEPGLRARMEDLAESLDEQAFEIQDRIDGGDATHDGYVVAFAHARAASAIHFALSDDPLEAAIEGVYEAYAAVGNLEEIRTVTDF